MVMEYLATLLMLFLVFLLLKSYYKIKIFDSYKQWLAAYAVMFVIGVALDTYAIMRGWWSFGNNYLIGLTIGVMPIEEYLIIIVLPFCIMVLYKIILKIK